MTKRPKFGDLPPRTEPLAVVAGMRAMPMLRPDQTMVGAMPDRNAEGPPLQPGPTSLQTISPTALAAGHDPSLLLPAPEIGLTQHVLPEAANDPRLILVDQPDSPRAANFRVLRHHLLEVGRPQVVVVSSANPGEGKTTTALNLALALAECGRAKVLLCEAHLRRPQLANLLRYAPPWCFAEQLAAHRHQPMLPWGFVDIPQLWLHVAAVGPQVAQTQLLDAPAFAIAMERLRAAGYDHIVIDAPPVLGSADVNLMQDAADGVVLAVRARTTTTRQLRNAIDQLSPSKIFGTVLFD